MKNNFKCYYCQRLIEYSVRAQYLKCIKCSLSELNKIENRILKFTHFPLPKKTIEKSQIKKYYFIKN